MDNISEQSPQSATGTRIRNVNTEHQARLSALERMAIYITDHVGTPGFFLIILIWTVSWILWNIYAPRELHVDKASEFAVWIFISNIIQLGLFPLLLVAQNLQTRHDELRAENEYAISVKSEQEIERVMDQLQRLEMNMATIMKHLGVAAQTPPVQGHVADLQEEEFAQHSQNIADAAFQRMTQMHQQLVDRFNAR